MLLPDNLALQDKHVRVPPFSAVVLAFAMLLLVAGVKKTEESALHKKRVCIALGLRRYCYTN